MMMMTEESVKEVPIVSFPTRAEEPDEEEDARVRANEEEAQAKAKKVAEAAAKAEERLWDEALTKIGYLARTAEDQQWLNGWVDRLEVVRRRMLGRSDERWFITKPSNTQGAK
ncbi:MAG: hypothetical protein LE178_01140 [Endomicrobium sp.]|nr:hypothetical protein [Endomicrobium sp.]